MGIYNNNNKFQNKTIQEIFYNDQYEEEIVLIT